MKLWALISRLLGVLSLRNAKTIEPTSAWAAVSSTSASTRYSFLHLSGLARALWANGASAEEHSQQTGPPSSGYRFPCLREIKIYCVCSMTVKHMKFI